MALMLQYTVWKQVDLAFFKDNFCLKSIKLQRKYFFKLIFKSRRKVSINLFSLIKQYFSEIELRVVFGQNGICRMFCLN